MYGVFSRFRRFSMWRARCNHLVRGITGWTYVYAMLFLGLLYSCWIIWKISNPPIPRVHPEAARMQVRMMSEQSAHNIAVVNHGEGTPGVVFSTPQQLRAATRRSMRARGVYLGAESKQLQADMLADISSYITDTGVCEPYLCDQVNQTVARLRQAGQKAAALDGVLRPMLTTPDGTMSSMEGELERLQDAWADTFEDVVVHAWVLHDVQVMHAQMMRRYPQRDPMPWLSRLMDTRHEPRYEP